jgi:hypothetical protein
MDFLLYLSPASQEVYKMISKKVRVVENTPICRQYDIYGWFDSTKNTLTFCTNKIKSKGNTKYDVNETLLHESVHVAQACKSNSSYMIPFGISKNQMLLTERRKNDVNISVSMNGENVRSLEHEAFWMEDKPNKVKYVVQKYCF